MQRSWNTTLVDKPSLEGRLLLRAHYYATLSLLLHPPPALASKMGCRRNALVASMRACSPHVALPPDYSQTTTTAGDSCC